jgi:hypothetical protein
MYWHLTKSLSIKNCKKEHDESLVKEIIKRNKILYIYEAAM